MSAIIARGADLDRFEELLDTIGGQARPGWQAHGRCVGMDPARFYLDKGDSSEAAHTKAVCETCPVQADCLAEALATNERFGIWGGTSPRARRGLRRRQATRRRPAA